MENTFFISHKLYTGVLNLFLPTYPFLRIINGAYTQQKLLDFSKCIIIIYLFKS